MQGFVQRNFFAAGLVDRDGVCLGVVLRRAFFDELDLDGALPFTASLMAWASVFSNGVPTVRI